MRMIVVEDEQRSREGLCRLLRALPVAGPRLTRDLGGASGGPPPDPADERPAGSAGLRREQCWDAGGASCSRPWGFPVLSRGPSPRPAPRGQ